VVKKTTNGKKVLEEAIDIFDKVNEKIDGLIGCSVKDFETLNSNFKSIYYNLQNIGEASNKIIKFIDLVCFNRTINQHADSIQFSKDKILESQNNNIIQLKQLDKTLNYRILLLSNIKQDLSTIKLLFTNLRFDPSILTDNKVVDKLLNTIIIWYEKQDQSIQKTRIEIKKIIRFAEEGIYSSIELLWEHIDKAENAFKYLNGLSKSIKNLQSQLNQLEEKMTSSTSEIITNLQFQDILRQQIEHVQSSHQEITSNLKNSHKEGEMLTIEELYKIRDINSLQSAQLIHANREYQKAVEIILNRINELTSIFGQYKSFWTQTCKPEGVRLQSLQPVLSDLNTSLNSHMFSLRHLDDKFQNMISELKSNYFSYVSNQVKKDQNKELTQLQEILNNIEHNHHRRKEYNPINQIYVEISKIKEATDKLHKSYIEEDSKKNSSNEPINVQPDNGIETIKRVSDTINELNDFFQNNSSNLNLNIQIQKTESFSIEQVTYYKTFEKEVQEIINLLDNLLTNINLSRTDINQEELEHLKEKYTMESERKVHDLVTGKENDKKKKDKENSDDVEFF
jgi:hypothetical protein